MDKIKDIQIVAVTKDNYHLYLDMIDLRVHGAVKERHKKRNQMPKHLSNPNLYVYAAMFKKEMIGWIHIVEIPKIGLWKTGYLYIDELWVYEKYRRQGIALKLLSMIEAVKKLTDTDLVRLVTHTPGAKKLYEVYGFESKSRCDFMEYRGEICHGAL